MKNNKNKTWFLNTHFAVGQSPNVLMDGESLEIETRNKIGNMETVKMIGPIRAGNIEIKGTPKQILEKCIKNIAYILAKADINSNDEIETPNKLRKKARELINSIK